MTTTLGREMQEHRPAILLRLNKFNLHPWLRTALEERTNVTAMYDSLPLEEMVMLDALSEGEYPGLRWLLRRQRGQYRLTLLFPTHVNKGRNQVTGPVINRGGL